MGKLKIRELTADAFAPYGTYFDVKSGYGDGAIGFQADRMLHYIGTPSLDSICSISMKYRPLELTVTEYHNDCEEVFGGFNCDVAFHVGLTKASGEIDYNSIAVFRLPAGCYARVKRGVLHHAGFVLDSNQVAYGIVLLPPATYTIDCHVLEYDKPIGFEL